MSGLVGISRRAWNHGEASCPDCGLHLDPHKDLVEYVRPSPDASATAVKVRHARCGYTGELVLVNP